MANEVPSLDDRVMPAHKLELTPEEAEFAATQGREADDPVPDPSSLSDETLEGRLRLRLNRLMRVPA